MLNSSVKFIIILSIAWLQGCFTIMALSLVSFGIFRSFAGGRHFKTDIGCLMGMLGIGEVTLLITYHSQKLPTILLILVLFITLICVILFAPMNSKINPIDDINNILFKRYMAILYVIIIIVIVCCNVRSQLKCLLTTTSFIEVITIIQKGIWRKKVWTGEKN